MRLGLRLFFAFFLIAGLSSFLLLRVVLTEVKPSVREVVEDIMVDSAHLLAELARDEMAALPDGGQLAGGRFERRLRDYANRPVDAQIWGLHKTRLDLRIYVTDARGRILLDTRPEAAVGADFSQRRDVALTLRGEYGARTSRDELGEAGAVMIVAAPVRDAGEKIIGVVSVVKPLATLDPIVARAERRILLAGLVLLALSLAVGVAVTLWLVASVRRLRGYAQRVQAGRREPPPAVPGELGELAQAMDAMRGRLDGREQVQHMVRALTHELKSPLAAMRASGELLQDELTAPDRQRFAAQVVEQSERLRELVDRMLELSKLEMLQTPAHPQRLRLDQLVDVVLAGLAGRIERGRLQIVWLAREPLEIEADRELLVLAYSNLLGNAIDFAPPGSALELSLAATGGRVLLSLRDHGPGVPPAARAQLGQPFFSTTRPGSVSKGSGLGLAIVERIAALHGGTLAFEPAEPGLRVTLALPRGF